MKLAFRVAGISAAVLVIGTSVAWPVATATRPICLYPLTAAYKGSGPTAAASSFVCRSSSQKK